MYNAVRAIVAAVLENKDGAEGAFSKFGKELFPERANRERDFDKKSQELLEKLGDKAIAVDPVAPVGSLWGARTRAVKVGTKKP